MMSEKKIKIKDFRNRHSTLLSLLIFTLIIYTSVFLSDELSIFSTNGLKLSAGVIVPSLFPFLIITDFCINYISFQEASAVRKTFEKVFNINGYAAEAFVCGLLSGFPIGAKLSFSLYERGIISKDECERLAAVSNNASPGYIISAIGIGLCGNITDGIILYAATVLSAITTAAIIGINKKKTHTPINVTEQKYDFALSVKSSAAICINITAFITIFSIISGMAKMMISNEFLLDFFLIFLEIGNAVSILSASKILSADAALLLTSFSIGFGGLCVFCQTKSLLSVNSCISMMKYIKIKLLQGVITLIYAFATIKVLDFF